MGISRQQFEQIQERLNGKKSRSSGRIPSSSNCHPARKKQIILGVDPSLRGTGYGVIQANGSQLVSLAYGTVSCPKDWEQSRCLVKISQILRTVIASYRPEACAVEGLFFAQNLKTAIVMGEARGAAIAAIAEAGIEIYEIATRKVKQAIVGYGAAQKLAVAKMVQRILGLQELPAPDAADALALALTHAQEQSRFSLKAPKKI